MAEQKKYKLDIFEVLGNISNSNTKYWNTLSEEQQNAFSPLVIMRWLSSNNPYEIFMLNHLVNKYIFSLGKHKHLLYNLMIISTIKNSRYKWIKREAKDIKFSNCIKALSKYLGYSIKNTKPILSLYNNDEILEICQQLGYEKNQISLVKKELKLRNV